MNTIKSVNILLPKNVDYSKWAVVACDQFTSEDKYWKDLEKYVGDSPSTLKLIFPEVYLEDSDAGERINNINKTMKEYLANGIFEELKDSFILVKRDTAFGASRLGLVAAIDLEDYCFTHPSHAYIRSTENVVPERIPPRLKIRKDASIELPHIMLLIDDRKKMVIESLYAKRNSLEKVYDFDLNMKGGHLTGYRVDAKEVIDLFNQYEKSVEHLYSDIDVNDFIFAVGDGNHSLATAQAHWNEVKKTLTKEEQENSPARFALCEIENLHDEGIAFEPIHRFVFNADKSLIEYFNEHLSGSNKANVYLKGKKFEISVDRNSAKAIKQIQEAIDAFIKENAMCSVDYIHGMDHLRAVAKENKGIAIEMPKIQKDELFAYVLQNGTLCRKAFSMGEAEEKRYYVEAKKIK